MDFNDIDFTAMSLLPTVNETNMNLSMFPSVFDRSASYYVSRYAVGHMDDMGEVGTDNTRVQEYPREMCAASNLGMPSFYSSSSGTIDKGLKRNGLATMYATPRTFENDSNPLLGVLPCIFEKKSKHDSSVEIV